MYPPSDKQLSFETEDAVYWFSHAFDPLNNWSAHAVTMWGERFSTVEHAYHFRKFSESSPKVAAEILMSPSPWAAMQLAKAHKSERRRDWEKVKIGLMTEINRAKVKQNEDVRICLLATGNRLLFENSPWDTFWGVGENGTGKNMMGKILMQIRDEFRPSTSG